MHQKLVYLLEDDADISELINFILSDAGYKVKQHNSINKLRAAITEILPDIFILDIILPDGNGLEVCKELRKAKATSSIPVLLMSANSSEQQVEAIGCKADFISKPFNINHLIDKVADSLTET